MSDYPIADTSDFVSSTNGYTEENTMTEQNNIAEFENALENAAKVEEKDYNEDIYQDESKESGPDRNERRATRRFYKFLDTIYKIAQLAGFRIEGRIVVRDIRTGKVFK